MHLNRASEQQMPMKPPMSPGAVTTYFRNECTEKHKARPLAPASQEVFSKHVRWPADPLLQRTGSEEVETCHVECESTAMVQDRSLAEFKSLCSKLGMMPEAAQSWAANHARPVLVMVTALVASFVGQAFFAVMFFCGFAWPTWHAFIPAVVMLAAGTIYFVGIYVRGPSFNGTAWQSVQSVISTPVLVFLALSPFIGPPGYIPFDNPVVATVGISGGMFSLVLSGSLAGTVASTEAAAMEGLHFALAQAALATLRAMNSLTDFRLVRVLIDKVCPLPRSWDALRKLNGVD